jgi:hypothetical protein
MADDIATSKLELRKFNRNNILMFSYMFIMFVFGSWGFYALEIMTMNNQDNGARSLIPNWHLSALIVVSALALFAATHWFVNKKILRIKKRALALGLFDDTRLRADIASLSESELVTLYEASIKVNSLSKRVNNFLSVELLQRHLVSENDLGKTLIVSNGTVKNIGLFHRVFLGPTFLLFYREFESYGYLVRFDRIRSARKLSKHTIGIWGIAANIIEIMLDDDRYPEPLEILPRYVSSWESVLSNSGCSLTETQ